MVRKAKDDAGSHEKRDKVATINVFSLTIVRQNPFKLRQLPLANRDQKLRIEKYLKH